MEAVPILLEALEDPVPAVRANVCWALGKLGDPRAIEPLIERLDDEDLSVQQDAQLALSQFDREDAKEALSYALL